MTTGATTQRLQELQQRLDQINRSWTKSNYEALLEFYVRVMPGITHSERCTIFVVDPGSKRIWSRFGTGIEEHEIEAPREDSLVGRVISRGESLIDNAPGGFAADVAEKTRFVSRNLACAPINSLAGFGVTGAIEVLNRLEGDYDTDDQTVLEEVAGFLSQALDSIRINDEMLDISNGLNSELKALRGGMPVMPDNFLAHSPAMKAVLEMANTVSMTPVNVFIQGENGTGKEVIARMIHRSGERSDKPFVAVNCASIPENLMESEFFGYEKGAFTGASGARGGRFEEADGGVLFLDEIADLPLMMQPKFLRALQEGEGMRLGSNKLRHYDLRVISATNKDLRKEVEEGRFREDLYYRLFAVEIELPPLRERHEDIIPMAMAFLDEISERFNRKVAGFSKEVIAMLESYPWPGNVRQLRREVERMVALTPQGQHIEVSSCSPDLRQAQPASMVEAVGLGNLPDRVRELEIRLIRSALEETGFNKLRASEILGITRQGLDKKLKRYGIEVTRRGYR